METKKIITDAEILNALVLADNVVSNAAAILGIPESTLRGTIKRDALLQEYVQVARRNRKLRDTVSYQKRKEAALTQTDNAVAAYAEEIAKGLDKLSPRATTKKHKFSPALSGVGVIQFSDVHFNEVVSDVQGNEYDFHVASKRIRLHVLNAIRLFKAFGFKNVLVAMTGDLLNSDRRLDELLVNATNRAKATLLAVDILQQAILELNEHFNVSVAHVSGNESRINKDMGWVAEMVSDNFDFQIFGMLKRLFKGAKGVVFLEGDPSELIVEVAGQNLMLIHGHNKLAGNPTSEVQKLIGKYISKGIKVDYVIFGHIHQAFCSDMFSRSASTVGSNAYSDKALNLTSRASQNIYAFWSNGNRDAIKVDLQNYEHIAGYDVVDELEAYNAKSADKARRELSYQETHRIEAH